MLSVFINAVKSAISAQPAEKPAFTLAEMEQSAKLFEAYLKAKDTADTETLTILRARWMSSMLPK